MSPSLWHLEHDAAELHIGPLSADLDLRCPLAGLANWRGLGDAADAVCVLGVETPAFRAGARDALVEAYLRGPDLIAVYREWSDWPVTLHAQWKALAADNSAGGLAAVELTVSVRTERLEAQPELYVVSRLPLGDLLAVADAGPPAEAAGPGCILVQPAHGDWSYAEMAHPADFGGTEAIPPADPAGAMLIRHRLFARRLEKGVLLRTRVRGVFLPRIGNASAAEAAYRAFACAELPLGT